jgi:hypothetical protein
MPSSVPPPILARESSYAPKGVKELSSPLRDTTDIRDLLEISQIIAKHTQILHEESKIDADLDLLMQNRPTVEKWLLKLDSARYNYITKPNTGLIAKGCLQDVKDCKQDVEYCSGNERESQETVLTNSLSDLEQSRVKQCAKILDDIQELKALRV